MAFKVRNKLYSAKDYQGRAITAPHRDCPCRPCWHLYHFPTRLGSHTIHNFDCVHRHNYGCPDDSKPTHILYLSKRLRVCRKGEVFRCLRCGQEVRVGVDDCHWIAVPVRGRKKIVEYLRKNRLGV